jgi:DNA-binding transcriptional MerR regulator
VRALHHYDAIGLLTPSLRTAAEHRLYTAADLARLQQIQSLRLMGLPLDEVKRLLDRGARVKTAPLSPRHVIDVHRARLREHIAGQTRVVERLDALAAHLDRAEAPSVDDLCRLIQEMTTMDQLSRHFTPEQQAALTARREGLGEARAQEIRAAWGEIIPAVRTAMQQGADPASPWREVVLPWRAFGTNGHDLMAVIIAAGPRPGPFALQLDEVRLR